MGIARARSDTNFDPRDFMTHIVKSNSGCWEWQGAKIRGYGSYKKWRAHRASWVLFRGSDPAEMHVCHKCDNPSCVNPNHLFLGNPKINAMDRQAKGRNVNLLGERHGSAKLTNQQVRDIKTLLQCGEVPQRKIAEMFNTHPTNISHIKRGAYWRSVDVSR